MLTTSQLLCLIGMCDEYFIIGSHVDEIQMAQCFASNSAWWAIYRSKTFTTTFIWWIRSCRLGDETLSMNMQSKLLLVPSPHQLVWYPVEVFYQSKPFRPSSEGYTFKYHILVRGKYAWCKFGMYRPMVFPAWPKCQRQYKLCQRRSSWNAAEYFFKSAHPPIRVTRRQRLICHLLLCYRLWRLLFDWCDCVRPLSWFQLGPDISEGTGPTSQTLCRLVLSALRALVADCIVHNHRHSASSHSYS